MSNASAILGWMGLCKAAGGVTSGFDSVLGEVRCGKSEARHDSLRRFRENEKTDQG